LIEAKIAKKIKDNKYSQLFISTHNLDFLKYIKRFKKSKPKQNENDKTDYEFPQYYFIEKSIKENTETSEIKKLPKCLEKYTTEFNYLFEQIYKFKNIDDTYNEDLKISLVYNFGNNLRKFLEIYLFFKYPNNFESLKQELIERFFNDTYQSDDIDKNQKIIAGVINRYQNEYSHLREILSRGMQPIDIEEAKKIAEFILETIKQNDKQQYKALVKSIGK
ncbi:TPA: AAA family ATPase, partial [Campylobacter coli]